MSKEKHNAPIVAIVGRPNVGKSTLFNRIIKRRDAIVHDAPGVTRDRHYATTDWAGRSFVLIDTGGYLPHARDIMEAAIKEQVEIAIEEADLLLFVVDRSTGITDVDSAIAEKVKRSGKPALVLVNKVDNEQQEAEAYEFYGLGLGDPLFVSAIQGRGIGDMLDILVSHLPRRSGREDREEGIHLAIIGKENVGKSSFVNTLVGKDRVIVTPIPGTTRDPIDTPIQFQKRKIILIDTAGLKRRSKVKENVLFYSQLRTLRSIERADVVMYFVDATRGVTRQDMQTIADTLAARKPLVLVINKWDLIPKTDKTLQEWETDIRQRLGTLNYIPIIFTSVTQKKRIFRLMEEAVALYDRYHQRIKTSELNDVLLPIIRENSPPAPFGKEIKINYVTQVQVAPPVFAFFGNHPELIPENYRRFLEKKIRENWDFLGIPIILSFRPKH